MMQKITVRKDRIGRYAQIVKISVPITAASTGFMRSLNNIMPNAEPAKGIENSAMISITSTMSTTTGMVMSGKMSSKHASGATKNTTRPAKSIMPRRLRAMIEALTSCLRMITKNNPTSTI